MKNKVLKNVFMNINFKFNRRSFVKGFLLISCFLFTLVVSSQNQSEDCSIPTSLSLTRFSTTNYVQGGHVAIFFEPEGVFELDNEFILELSDVDGSFTTSTEISRKSDFYLPALNGVIPTNIALGSNYKLRVRSTAPFTSLETDTFEIISVTSPQLNPTEIDYFSNSPYTGGENFIKCTNLEINDYFLGYKDRGQNEVTPSDAGGIKLKIINSLANSTTVRMFYNNSWQELSLNSAGQFAIPSDLPVNHYLLEIDQTQNEGDVNEYHNISGFIFHFNTNSTGIANTSSETVCVEDNVGFEVPISSLQSNYPGSLYSIHYGDTDLSEPSTFEYYSHARLINCNTLIHNYDTTTCASVYQVENPANNKFYFQLNFQLFSKGLFDSNNNDFECEEHVPNGTGTQKLVNVSLKPSAAIDLEDIICENSPIIATDISTEGLYGFGTECSTNYDNVWEYLSPSDTSWVTVDTTDSFFSGWVDDINKTLTIPGFLTQSNPGCWQVRLVIFNELGCVQTDTAEETVIVEPAPVPSFTYSPSEDLCIPVTINFTNTSNTESVQPPACGNPMYTWSVVPDETTPATADGFVLIDADTDDTIPAENQTDININFDQPGTYTVTLELENICGVETFFQDITVIGDPTVVFNPDLLEVCQVFPADYTLDFSDTEIAPTYSESPFTPEDYLWEVYEADGVTPATNYSFLDVNGETLDFPQINFTAYGTYIIRVSVSGDCGGGATDDFTFILKREPVLTNTVLTQTLCSEDSTNLIDFTSDILGTTYKWEATTSDPITGFPEGEQETASIPSLSLINSCNVTGVVTVAVTPFLDDCAGDTVNLEFIVNPKPSINNIDVTICSDEQFLIEIENDCTVGDIIPEDTTYTWEVLSISGEVTGVALNDNGTGYVNGTVTNTSASDVLIVYEVIPTSNEGCLGALFTVTVTIKPEPVVENQITEVCSDVVLDYVIIGDDSPQVASYTLISIESNSLFGLGTNTSPATGLTANAIKDDVWNNETSSPVDVVYTFIPIGDNVCEGDAFTVTVTVNPEPVVADQDVVVCSDEAIGYTLDGDTDTPLVATYNLTGIVDNGLVGLPTNQGIAEDLTASALEDDVWTNTTANAVDVVYTLVPVGDNGCLGDEFTVTVTINPEPVVADQDVVVCNDVAIGYTLEGDTDTPLVATYNLTGIVDNGLVGVPTNQAIAEDLTASDLENDVWTNTTANAVDVVYTLVPVGDNGCLGDEFTLTVTVNPEPVVADQDVVVCSDEALNIDFGNSSSVVATSYNITNLELNGLVVSAGNAAVSSGLLATDLSDDAFTNVTPAPVAVIYTVVPVTAEDCEGDSFTVTVTVNPEPVVNTISDIEVCSGETVNTIVFSTTNIGGLITYNWQINTGIGLQPLFGSGDIPFFISENLSNIPVTATVTVTPTFTANGLSCEGVAETFQIIVNPKPSINDKTVEICSEDTFSVQPLNNIDGDVVPNGTVYSWQVLSPNPNITGASSGSGSIISQTLTNTSNSPQVVVYEVTPISNAIGACEGATFTIEVTVSPRPVLPNQNFEICSGETFTYSPINNPPLDIVPIATTYTWTFVDNPNINGETNGTDQNLFEQINLSNTSNIDQDVMYFVTASAGSCSSSFEIQLTVKARPFIPYDSGLTDTRCSGDSFVIQPVNGIPDMNTIVPINTTYTWEVIPNPNLIGWSDVNIPTGLISQQLFNTTNVNQSIEYIITPYSGVCEGPSFSAIIWIEPKPFIPNHIETLCDGDSFIFSPVNGVFPDTSTIVPDLTLYTWTVSDLSGGLVTGYSDGVDQPFLDTGILLNDSAVVQTLVYTITPTYYVPSNPGVPRCIGDDFTLTVSLNPGVDANASITNISCSYSPLCGGSIELDPIGIGPFTYNWTYVGTEINAISNPNLEDQFNLCPGDYTVEITDALNCVYTFNYSIVPPIPVSFNLLALVDLSCNNVSPNCDGYIEVDLNGGTAPYTLIEWYTESIPSSANFDQLVATNSPILQNACEGNYVLKVIDANGCEFVSPTYTVNETGSPILVTEQLSNYNGFNVSCTTTNDGFIEVDVSGGSGSFSYLMTPGNLLDADITTPNLLEFSNLGAGDYTLTITDTNCPLDIVLNYTLTAPQALVSSHSQTSGPALCNGDTVTYNVAASGGVPPYTGTGNYTFTAGTYPITITDANGCTTTETITVTEPTALNVTAVVSQPIDCFAGIGEITITAIGGTTPYVGTGVVQVNAGEYFYTVTDANNCSFTNSIIITEPAQLTYTVDVVENPTCSPDWSYTNGTICIIIAGGTNPVPLGPGWVNNGSGQWCLSNLSSGDYTIDVTDVNSCTSDIGNTIVTLTRPPVIDAFITSDINTDCSINTISQTNYVFVNGGTPPYQFTWSGGDTCVPINAQCMETTVSGTYTVFIHDQESLANGCPPIEVDVMVDLPEIGDAFFDYTSPNSLLCNVLAINEPILFNSLSTGDIVNITWDFGDGSPDVVGDFNPTHIYSQVGSYQVDLTVEYPYGCTETYTEVIQITKGYDIILPNAFTPNGDGLNDTIRPVTLCVKEMELSVYDTWGSLIYVEVGIDDNIKGWDGTINGQSAENGNYIIVVKATTYRGETIDINGPITLIK